MEIGIPKQPTNGDTTGWNFDLSYTRYRTLSNTPAEVIITIFKILKLTECKRLVKKHTLSFIGIVILFMVYLIATNAYADSRDVLVNADIWDFLKYLGIVLLGILAWIGNKLSKGLDALVIAVGDLRTAVEVNKTSVRNIETDLSEIKQAQKTHEGRIFDLEKRKG